MSVNLTVVLDPYSVPHLLNAIAVTLGDTFDIESCQYKWDMKKPYEDGWSIDPDSQLADLLSRVYPIPGLSQHEEPTEAEFEAMDGDGRFDIHARRLLNMSGFEFVYQDGWLRAKLKE